MKESKTQREQRIPWKRGRNRKTIEEEKTSEESIKNKQIKHFLIIFTHLLDLKRFGKEKMCPNSFLHC